MSALLSVEQLRLQDAALEFAQRLPEDMVERDRNATHLWTNSIPILRYGNEAQRHKYLKPLCDGSLIGANAASEPDAGSDIFSMRTRARREGEYYVLSGTIPAAARSTREPRTFRGTSLREG